MVKPEVLAWRGVVLGWRKTTKALPCSPDFRFHVDSDWSGKMLMMHWWHKNGRCYLTSYCKNWVTLKVNAMGEERIAVTLSHSPQELIAGISVMRKNVIVYKREGKSGHRIKINLPPCSLTFKVCGGERDEGARWWRMALRIPNWLRAWPQPGMEACPFQNLQVHLKGMADSVCTGVQPLCIPSCTPACSCCRQQQDHLSLALSLTQREPSPLSSGKENMGFLPFLCYPLAHFPQSPHLLVETNTSAPRRSAAWHYRRWNCDSFSTLFFFLPSWQSALTWVTSSLCFQSLIFCTWGQTLGRQ